MPKTTLRRAAEGALLGFVLSTAPAWAQITLEPQSVSVTVEQHVTETHIVTLTNAGVEPLAFCLTFDRPLQRASGALRLAEGAGGGGEPCGEYGEVLYRYDEDDFGAGWDPFSITMTPKGRLFIAEGGGLKRTFEFTRDLQLLRSFEHPHIAELTPFSGTGGVTYDATNETLWWMNLERTSVSGQIVTRRVLLLEGDLNGVETGDHIEIVPPKTPIEDFFPTGLSYEFATDLFYLTASSSNDIDPDDWKLWAVDRAGTPAEGYPLRPDPYPGAFLLGPDVYAGADGGVAGLRIELGVLPADEIN